MVMATVIICHTGGIQTSTEIMSCHQYITDNHVPKISSDEI